MAISSGVRPHSAFIEVGGQRFPVVQGHVGLAATMESSEFSVTLPMSLNGAESAFASVSGLDATITVNDQTLFTGLLDEGRFDYIERMISLSGRCKSAKLHQTKISQSWQNKKPNDIIQDLAQQAGLTVDVSAVQAQLKAGRVWDQDWVKLSANVSASSTLHKLAEMMGWRWWVDENGQIVVKDKADAGGAYQINYAASDEIVSDALQLSVRRNYQASQGIEVSVKSWDQKKKKTHEKKAKIKAASGDGTGGVGESLKYEYQIPALDDDHVERFAKSKAREHARHEVTIDATCVGDPSCRAGMQLQLSGTSFDGSYDIDHVDHQFGMSGYVMHLTARTDPPEATTQ